LAHKHVRRVHEEESKEGVARTSDKDKYLSVLSIDGGGIRGLMPALWLEHIDDIIHKKSNIHIHKLFDIARATLQHLSFFHLTIYLIYMQERAIFLMGGYLLIIP